MVVATPPPWEGINVQGKFDHRPRVVVLAGRGPAGQAGGPLLAELAERNGLDAEPSPAVAPLAKRVRCQDPARVMVDLALAPAAGGECISDRTVLRQSPELFGEAASTSTAWLVLDFIGPRLLARLTAAEAGARTSSGSGAWCFGS